MTASNKKDWTKEQTHVDTLNAIAKKHGIPVKPIEVNKVPGQVTQEIKLVPPKVNLLDSKR